MPTYEFRCSNGHTFDQFHKISDAPSVAACPTCGAEAQRAISGGAGLVFKGSGFYLTDYGKNAHRAAGPAKPGESGGGEGKSESKSEGKPESKSDGGAKAEGGAKGDGGSKGGGSSSAPAAPPASGGKGDSGGSSKGAA